MSQKSLNIAELNPLSKDFTLLAKVMSKTELRPMASGASKDRMVFGMELGDGSGRIRAAAFDDVAKKFHSMIGVGEVYRFSNFAVKQPLYETSTSKYEIWLKLVSEITPESQELEVLPEVVTVTPLSSLIEEQNQPVNVVGVIRRVGEPTTIKSSDARELEIADDSGNACLLTLWGSWSTGAYHRGDIVAVTKAKISAFKGISLSTSTLSSVTINPADNDVVTRLSQWMEEDDVDIEMLPLVGKEKRRKTEKLTDIIKSGTAMVRVKKIFLDRKMTFKSKKTGHPEAVLKMMVEDSSARLSVTVFDPSASQLLGYEAQQIEKWYDEANIEQLEAMTTAVEGKSFQIDLWKQNEGSWIAQNFTAAEF